MTKQGKPHFGSSTRKERTYWIHTVILKQQTLQSSLQKRFVPITSHLCFMTFQICQVLLRHPIFKIVCKNYIFCDVCYSFNDCTNRSIELTYSVQCRVWIVLFKVRGKVELIYLQIASNYDLLFTLLLDLLKKLKMYLVSYELWWPFLDFNIFGWL